jgi:hypothetical protein
MIIAMLNKEKGVPLKDRKQLLKTYPKSFVGSEMVDWLVSGSYATSRKEAAILALELQGLGLFTHVAQTEKPFIDGTFFYKFTFEVHLTKTVDTNVNIQAS